MQLYMRAVQKGAPGQVVAGGSSAAKDFSKMSPAEKKKEIARRRAEAQKEKVRRYPSGIRVELVVLIYCSAWKP